MTNSLGIACNGTIVVDSEMGEVIQLQGDQRKDVQEFLTDKKEGLELDAKTIKVINLLLFHRASLTNYIHRSTVSKIFEACPTKPFIMRVLTEVSRH
jgi:hypothetical protein